jgi:hypothetical protein
VGFNAEISQWWLKHAKWELEADMESCQLGNLLPKYKERGRRYRPDNAEEDAVWLQLCQYQAPWYQAASLSR